ncbi:tRNA-lysidine synthetase [Moraxella macacae 0408225]|uniref:tRNA(Ile)-lysidine synthase n=1 Tax=Moraxella macacae 0408225 TaxID=1230338 RepID=L2F7J4_9GAMM|nr:tRNA lysidine(34) synthetase TilS [Moraxella macacae]ELA08875.1 tRNA-lysidine synthetase [Moraxella macacae 0408225]
MHPILHTIWQSYHKHILSNFSPNQSIYIACSGGRDSMCLLYACHLLKLPIKVIHINHQLQAVNDDWQTKVEQFCQLHQIPCQTKRLIWQNPSHVNEQNARDARYQAFCQLTSPGAIIATGHHAYDQAETVLANFCQGTGITGLLGMSTFSTQHAFAKPLHLWRPLLSISRDTISEFVALHQIPYVDDPTNQYQPCHTEDFDNTNNQRAWLRHEVFPILNLRFHKVSQNIARTCQNLAKSEQILQEIYQQDLAFCQTTNSWTMQQQCLNIDNLQKLSQARIFQLLHYWVKAKKPFAPNQHIIEQIYQLILTKNSEQQTIIAWQGIQIRRYQQTLYRLDANYLAVLAQNLPLFWHNSNHATDPYQSRNINPGESFQRLGKSHHERFKKICQALKIPAWERGFASVLQKNGQDFALCFANQCVFLTNF